MTLWTQDTAKQATSGTGNSTWQASRVIIDSRTARPGDLYVALKGERFDGHDFVKDALAKGAVAAIVSKSPQGVAADAPLLRVADTQAALEALARFARKRSRAKTVGVTGSVGKTSTKEMITLALGAHGTTHSNSGNLNNHIGVPLSLANLPEDTDFAVFEMGMNHAGEIAALTKLVQPDVAVVTNVDAVHLEFFPSVEAIADAKAEIFMGVSPQGIAVLNADNAYTAQLKKAAASRGIANIVTCGQSGEYRLADYRATASGAELMVNIRGKKMDVALSAIGRHWAMTALFALAVAHELGLPDEKTAKALAKFSEPEGRGRVSRIANEALLVDDSYNASPASMRAAFAKTKEVWEAAGKKGRKLAALGDMLELGKETISLHTALAEDLQQHGFAAVFTAGASMKHLHDALPPAMRAAHVALADALVPVLHGAIAKDDVILVKGSHGSHMYEVARALQAGEQKHAV